MLLDQAQRKIVEQFASQRTGFDRAARPTVKVAHEALIRASFPAMDRLKSEEVTLAANPNPIVGSLLAETHVS